MNRRELMQAGLGAVIGSALGLTSTQAQRASGHSTMTPSDLSATDPASYSPLILWYPRPAANWLEALPIGNGRLGAMVFGGVPEETLPIRKDWPRCRRSAG